MLVRWKVGISGTVHGRDQGVRPGDVMEIADLATVIRYLKNGFVEEQLEGEVGLPYRSADPGRIALLEAELASQPRPLDELRRKAKTVTQSKTAQTKAERLERQRAINW